MQLIRRVKVGKGIICSLLLKSNVLYVGGAQVVSVYSLDTTTTNDDNDETNNSKNIVSDVTLFKHIQVETDDKVYFKTFTECGQFDFWLGGSNSNKIYHLLIDRNSEIFGQLNNYTLTDIIDNMSELEQLRQRLTYMNSKNKILTQTVQELQQQITQLTNQHDSEKHKNKELVNQLETYLTRNTQLKIDLKQNKRDLLKMTKMNTSIKTHTQKLLNNLCSQTKIINKITPTNSKGVLNHFFVKWNTTLGSSHQNLFYTQIKPTQLIKRLDGVVVQLYKLRKTTDSLSLSNSINKWIQSTIHNCITLLKNVQLDLK
jgi:hypothetical protein